MNLCRKQIKCCKNTDFTYNASSHQGEVVILVAISLREIDMDLSLWTNYIKSLIELGAAIGFFYTILSGQLDTGQLKISKRQKENNQILRLLYLVLNMTAYACLSNNSIPYKLLTFRWAIHGTEVLMFFLVARSWVNSFLPSRPRVIRLPLAGFIALACWAIGFLISDNIFLAYISVVSLASWILSQRQIGSWFSIKLLA